MRFKTNLAAFLLAASLVSATTLTTIAQDANNSPAQPTPLVAAGLPGTPTARLMAPSQYISPLATLIGPSRQPSTPNQLSQYYRSRGRFNLSRVPEMFGDFRTPGQVLLIEDLAPASGLQTEIPVSAGIGGLRIGENNHALPRDRFFVSYNYFHNALETIAFPSAVASGGGAAESTSLDRITIGREFLFDDGRTSAELRMTFAAPIDITGRAVPADPSTAFAVESDGIGNFGLIFKRLLYANGCLAWSAGIGIETPTGSTGVVTLDGNRYELDPQSVHLIPFLAATERSGRWFGHLFTQMDVAVGGDELSGTVLVGENNLNAAPLLGIDVGLGYWLIPQQRGSIGVAALAELHSTTALGSDDSFIAIDSDPDITVGVNNAAGVSNDLLNFTTGLVFAGQGGWTLRTAIAFPTLSERIFDSEAIVQLNRRF